MNPIGVTTEDMLVRHILFYCLSVFMKMRETRQRGLPVPALSEKSGLCPLDKIIRKHLRGCVCRAQKYRTVWGAAENRRIQVYALSAGHGCHRQDIRRR